MTRKVEFVNGVVKKHPASLRVPISLSTIFGKEKTKPKTLDTQLAARCRSRVSFTNSKASVTPQTLTLKASMRLMIAVVNL